MDEEIEAQRGQVIAQGHKAIIINGSAGTWSQASGPRAFGL